MMFGMWIDDGNRIAVHAVDNCYSHFISSCLVRWYLRFHHNEIVPQLAAKTNLYAICRFAI